MNATTASKGQRVGYVRVSTADQNTERQLEGVELDQVFEDKKSGKDADRPGLKALEAHVRTGDTVLVHSMDRLARNLDDLRRIVTELTARGVRVEFVKEGLTFTGDDKAMSKFLLSVMGAFAEFERSLILERQREGIAVAKANGVYKGRKPKLSADQLAELKDRAANGETKTALAESFGVSRQTVYTLLST
jgi:DNA invertase Pin-like site-specific DNA recombinase